MTGVADELHNTREIIVVKHHLLYHISTCLLAEHLFGNMSNCTADGYKINSSRSGAILVLFDSPYFLDNASICL
jgi:hypothetical protein